MAIIPTSKAQPGMKLAAPVLDSYKNPILTAGQELSEKHLHLLKTWGISELNVVAAEEAADPGAALVEMEPGVLTAFQNELNVIFRKTNREHPAIKELYRLALLMKTSKKRGAGI